MPSASFNPGGALARAERIDEPRFGLPYALGVAVLLHLLLLLLVWANPGLFVPPRALLFEPPEKDTPPPIKFTFMDLVDDRVVDENPDAELVSDKAREEAGETPRVTTPDGEEPPSEGNTTERIDGGTTPERVPEPPRPQDAVELPRPAPQPPQAAAPQPPARDAEEAEAADGDEPTPPAEPAEEPPRAATSRPQPGPGGVEEGAEDGRDPRRPESRQERRQERFSSALEEMALPLDLQAQTPPDPEESAPAAGRSTIWQFDNANPAYPVNIGSLSFDSKGADFGPWLREFHARVLNEWHRNLEAWSDEIWRTISATPYISDQEKHMRRQLQMSRLRGVTGVDFVVTREGSVVQLEIIRRSGHAGLDRSVQRTLRNVILPPLPDDYPDERLPIRAGFYFNVPPPN